MEIEKCFRGIEWRIKLGVLPSSSSIDAFRRAAADQRRRYAELRRGFLVDPHIGDGRRGVHQNIDNPLSQDPGSKWGRFFQTAELERSIEKDISRLYPEHSNYFQTSMCQSTLKRILLIWSLKHSVHGYCQGMHELLAPLLYVLQVDVMQLSHMRHVFEDAFDKFDNYFPFEDSSLLPHNFDKNTICGMVFTAFEDGKESDGVEAQTPHDFFRKTGSIDELDPKMQEIFRGNDVYGAEGELGSLLSGRFIEHDAYAMFDAMLSGQGNGVPMEQYFLNASAGDDLTGLPPVIEASADIYQLLSLADLPLYNHLIQFRIEPQFFSLRWLRLLFGREFELQDLLLVWDAIFSAPTTGKSSPVDRTSGAHSPTGSAFVSAMAVSMIIHLRSPLLACPDATTCLKKLLNFPRNVDVRKLIDVANESFAMGIHRTSLLESRGYIDTGSSTRRKHIRSASASLPLQSPSFISPKGVMLEHQNSSPFSDKVRTSISESYWEEKWTMTVLQKMGYMSDDEHCGKKGSHANTSRRECATPEMDSESVSSDTSYRVAFGSESSIKQNPDASLSIGNSDLSTNFGDIRSVSPFRSHSNQNDIPNTVLATPNTCHASISEELLDERHSRRESDGFTSTDVEKPRVQSNGPWKGFLTKSTSLNSQTGGILAIWKRQKPPLAAPNSGRFRWPWKFSKLIPGGRNNAVVSKDSFVKKDVNGCREDQVLGSDTKMEFPKPDDDHMPDLIMGDPLSSIIEDGTHVEQNNSHCPIKGTASGRDEDNPYGTSSALDCEGTGSPELFNQVVSIAPEHTLSKWVEQEVQSSIRGWPHLAEEDESLNMSLKQMGHSMLKYIQILECALSRDAEQIYGNENDGSDGEERNDISVQNALKELQMMANKLLQS